MKDLRAGWLHALITFGEGTYEFYFSDVANDALRELAHLGLFLISDEQFGCGVTFWLEPEGYELRASRDEEQVLALAYSESAFAKLFPPIKTLDSFPVDGPVVAREIARALRGIESQLVSSARMGGAPDQRWSHPYPVDLVEQLEGALP